MRDHLITDWLLCFLITQVIKINLSFIIDNVSQSIKILIDKWFSESETHRPLISEESPGSVSCDGIFLFP